MKINEILKKRGLVAHKYEKIGKVTIIETSQKKYAYKESHIDEKIISYLESRNFDYMPRIYENNDYLLTDYIETYDIPDEQRMIDLIRLTALLHSKTTHYREIDSDEYEKIYEDIDNNLNYLYSYYTDIITIVESKVYPSPSEQLISRNISKIYEIIDKDKEMLDHWHATIKEKTKERNVVLHNNLNLSHFIRNKKSYLISWEKSKIGIPIFDIYKLYKSHVLDFDFKSLLEIYESSYPLKKDERELFFIMISMPEIIQINGTEYEKCKNISKMLDKIYKTEKLISPKTSK